VSTPGRTHHLRQPADARFRQERQPPSRRRPARDSGAVLMLGLHERRCARGDVRASARGVLPAARSSVSGMKGETSGHVPRSRRRAHRLRSRCIARHRPARTGRWPRRHAHLLWRRRRCGGELARIPEPAGGRDRAADRRESRRQLHRRLYAKGPTRIAQKVGEEGLEVALAAVAEGDDKVVSESADLLYHLLVLLKSRGVTLARVVAELESRHAGK